MKHALLYIISQLALVSFVFGQNKSEPFPSVKFLVDNAVDISETNKEKNSSLQVIREAIGSKRIVFLGEASHHDQSIKDEKNRLIKYLHDSLGFNVLLEELSIFPYNLLESVVKSNVHLDYLYNMLDGTDEMSSDELELMKYVWGTWKRGDSLHIKGIDVYNDIYQSKSYAAFLDSLITVHQLPLENENDWIRYIELIRKDSVTAEELKFVEDYAIDVSQKMPANQPGYLAAQLIKNARGYLQHVYYMPIIKPSDYSAKLFDFYYHRDMQMADNLLYYLVKVYPDQKIIVSTSNYHISRNVESIRYQNKYFKKGVPMGQYVWDKYKDDIYSIAIVSTQGSMGFIAEEKNIKPINRRAFKKVKSGDYKGYIALGFSKKKVRKGSLEYFISKSGSRAVFVDFTTYTDKNEQLEEFYLHSTFHESFKSKWSESFDGVVILKEALPVELKGLLRIHPGGGWSDLNYFVKWLYQR